MSISFSSIVWHLLHHPSSHSPIINFLSLIHPEMMILLFMSSRVNIYSVVDRSHRWIDVGDRKKEQSFHSHCQRSVDTLIGLLEEWTKTDIVCLVHPSRRWRASCVIGITLDRLVVCQMKWLISSIQHGWELLPFVFLVQRCTGDFYLYLFIFYLFCFYLFSKWTKSEKDKKK